jgi:HD-GYP domain-containing protein (c-di-GMP phosphodiesterase class II)
MTSEGPERAYKSKNLTPSDAASLLRRGVAAGRYEPRIAEVFIRSVLGLD